jgi:hypothetical protein
MIKDQLLYQQWDNTIHASHAAQVTAPEQAGYVKPAFLSAAW